jgi:tetratricopeptide (TPR) repeat protein
MSETAERRWEAYNEAGCRYFSQGELAQAEQSFLAAIREAMALGADSVHLASSLDNLGQLKYRQHELAEAEDLFRRSLSIRERALGSDHYGVVQSVNNLATLYYARGELDAAEPLFRRALALGERHLGGDHPDVAISLNNLARLCFRRDDFAAAVPLLTRLLSIKEREGGAGNPEVAAILTSLAKVRVAQRDYAAAAPLARRALAIREQAAARDDPVLATNLHLLADICAALGQHEEERELRAREQSARAAEPAADHAPILNDGLLQATSFSAVDAGDSAGEAAADVSVRSPTDVRAAPAADAQIAFVHGSDPIVPQVDGAAGVPLAPPREPPHPLPRAGAPTTPGARPGRSETTAPRPRPPAGPPRDPHRSGAGRPSVTGPRSPHGASPRGSTQERRSGQTPVKRGLVPRILLGAVVLMCLLAAAWFAAGRPPLQRLLATVTTTRTSPAPTADATHTAAGAVP